MTANSSVSPVEMASGARPKVALVVCACRDEAFAVQDIFVARGGFRNLAVKRLGHLSYICGDLPDEVTIAVSYPFDNGSDFAIDHVKEMLPVVRPTLVVMTGVCAGLRGRVKVGDILVSTAAFNYAAGEENANGKLAAPKLFGPPEGFLRWIEMALRGNDAWRNHPVVPNPLFELDSADFAKRALFEYSIHRDALEDSQWLWANGFDITKSVSENRILIPDYSETISNLLDSGAVEHIGRGELQLSDTTMKAMVDEVPLFGGPRTNGLRTPELRFVIFGSGPAIRFDVTGRESQAFSDCRRIHSETLAVDMETAGFYLAFRHQGAVDYVAVKAVSNHADALTDYPGAFTYSMQLAAGFILEIVRNYDWHLAIGQYPLEVEPYLPVAPNSERSDVEQVYQPARTVPADSRITSRAGQTTLSQDAILELSVTDADCNTNELPPSDDSTTDELAAMFSEQITSLILTADFAKALDVAKTAEAWSDSSASRSSSVCQRLLLVIAKAWICVKKVGLSGAETESICLNLAKKALDKLEASVDVSLRTEYESLLLWVQHAKGSEQWPELEERTDPTALRARLDLLIANGRVRDAANLVVERAPDAEWILRGIDACTLNGDNFAVRRFLSWARATSIPLWQASLSRYANATMELTGRKHDTKELYAEILDEEDKEVLRAAVGELAEPVRRLGIQGRCANRTEAAIVVVFLQMSHLLKESSDLTDIAATLTSIWSPIPLEYAQMVCVGVIAASDDLPARLRAEHPKCDEANVLAIQIMDILGIRTQAFEEGLKLAYELTELQSRAKLGWVLAQLSAQLGSEAMSRFERIRERLVPTGGLQDAVLRAQGALREGLCDKALQELESCRDENDSIWLQMFSQALAASGKLREACDTLRKASTLFWHPDFSRRLGLYLVELGDMQEAIKEFERYLASEPDDLAITEHLCSIYFADGRFEATLELLQRLHLARPTELRHGLNLGNLLLRLGELDESIKVYRSLHAICNPSSLETLFPLAHALRIAGRVNEAFELVEKERELHWNDGRFLCAYLNLAFESGNEDKVGPAFRQIDALRLYEDNASLIRQVSLDQIVALARSGHEARKAIANEVLFGRRCWMATESGPHLDTWKRLTRPTRWIPELPWTQAASCIYATNGLVHRKNPDGTATLMDFGEVAKGTTLVADVSALLTLFELGHLEGALDHFGEIYVPRSYRTAAIQEGTQVAYHQPAREAAMRAIHGEVVRQRIIPSSLATSEPELILNDFDDEDGAVKAADILTHLHRRGIVSDLVFADQLGNFRGGTGRALGRNQVLMAELETLVILTQAHLLEHLLGEFKVRVSGEDYTQLLSHVSLFDEERQKGENKARFWSILTNSVKVHFKPPLMSETPFLESLTLASEESLPLLADDRVLQAAAAHSGIPVYGAVDVLRGMSSSSSICPESLSRAYLFLVQWRYRFLIPPAEVLAHLSDKYKESPPGDELQQIASYLHDCMSDLGLFHGIEQTVPKLSMALGLFAGWIENVSQLILLIGARGVPGKTGDVLLEWICQFLVPSDPNFLDDSGFGETAKLRLLESIMLRLGLGEEHPKKFLSRVGKALGFNSDSVQEILLHRITNLDRALGADEDVQHLVARNLVIVALETFDSISLGLARYSTMRGLVEFNLPSVEERSSIFKGPLEIEQTDSGTRLTKIAELLRSEGLSSNLEQHLIQLARSDNFDPRNNKRIIELLGDGTKPELWALEYELSRIVEQDLLQNLKGLEYCVSIGFVEGFNEFLKACLLPSRPALVPLAVQQNVPSSSSSSDLGRLDKMISESTFRAALDGFLSGFGFAPFEKPFTLENVIFQWQKKHGTPVDIWAELNEWAEGPNVLRQFHVARFLLGNLSIVPPDERESFIKRVAQIFVGLSARGPVWSTRRLLARHYYSHFLNCGMLRGFSDSVAVLSLWLTDQLATIIERGGEEFQESFHKTLVHAEVSSSFEAGLCHANYQMKPGVLTLGLAGPGCVWSRAIEYAITSESFGLLQPFLDTNFLLQLQKNTLNFWTTSSTEFTLGSGSLSYLLDALANTEDTVDGTGKTWLADVKRIATLDLEEVLAELTSLDCSSETRLILATRIESIVGSSISSHCDVWTWLHNSKALPSVIAESKELGFHKFIDVLVSLKPSDKPFLLGHEILDALELEKERAGRVRLISFAIRCAVSLRQVSVANRLTQTELGAPDLKWVADWNASLLRLLRVSNTRTGSKVRPVALSLSRGLDGVSISDHDDEQQMSSEDGVD